MQKKWKAVFGLVSLMLAIGMAQAQDVVAHSWTYSNCVLNTTGTVGFVSNPYRLKVRISSQTITNDVYMCCTSNALQALKQGTLLKFTATNYPANFPGVFTFPVQDVGYGSIYFRSADGSTPTLSLVDIGRQ